MLDALCQCAGHSSGTTGEIDRSVLRLRLRCVDDQRDDVVGVQFWSGGEANRLPAELVADRAFVRGGVFGAHGRSDREIELQHLEYAINLGHSIAAAPPARGAVRNQGIARRICTRADSVGAADNSIGRRLTQ